MTCAEVTPDNHTHPQLLQHSTPPPNLPAQLHVSLAHKLLSPDWGRMENPPTKVRLNLLVLRSSEVFFCAVPDKMIIHKNPAEQNPHPCSSWQLCCPQVSDAEPDLSLQRKSWERGRCAASPCSHHGGSSAVPRGTSALHACINQQENCGGSERPGEADLRSAGRSGFGSDPNLTEAYPRAGSAVPGHQEGGKCHKSILALAFRMARAVLHPGEAARAACFPQAHQASSRRAQLHSRASKGFALLGKKGLKFARRRAQHWTENSHGPSCLCVTGLCVSPACSSSTHPCKLSFISGGVCASPQ